jgi:hypothetical protein
VGKEKEEEGVREGAGEEKGGEKGAGEGAHEQEQYVRGKETVNNTGWPKWMSDGFHLLWDCEGGQEWDEAVVKWTELERAYGFVNSVSANS